MNDLRVILLIAGIALIAIIYLWETLKQKRNLRARIDNLHVPARNTAAVPRITPAADAAEDERELADFNLFLHQEETPVPGAPAGSPGTPAVRGAGTELRTGTAPGGGGDKAGAIGAQEIVVIYITTDKQPCFTGTEILKAVKAADMHYGDMRIFHNYGPDPKHAGRPLFSLANISEPGYFVMDDMKMFTTKGLTLFMCLPAEMGGDIAFEFMLDTASGLARALGGVLRGGDHNPLDEDAVNRLRDIACRY